MADRLRPLWDFDDLDATEQRLRTQLQSESSDTGRAELLTQIARVHGLRDDFEDAMRTLDEAEQLSSVDVVRVRLDLERGRVHRSSGKPEEALPHFEAAFERARASGENYLAGDAAHMCAIAVPDLESMERWTHRGLELGEREPDAAYWAGPLLNNLAWSYFDAADYERALDLFRRALEVRERESDNPSAIAWAKYGVGQTLRMLGRSAEAVPLLEEAVAWSDIPAFREELALERAEL
jgi:tetratricopeptide (TPR) repeat protein